MLEADNRSTSAEILHERLGYRVMRYSFSLPAIAETNYRFEGRYFPVNAASNGNVRMAYVSCNGKENGDRERDHAERNRMWRRLAEQHSERPLQLLLHGGDQLYADEMLSIHPVVKQWARGKHRVMAGLTIPDDVYEQLRDYLFTRYLEVYSQPEIAWLMARVPSLAMWDDHDICDGWGSLPKEKLDSPVGQAVFAIAREFFLLFQLGAAAETLSDVCPDTSGRTLTWHLRFPGFSLLAPDRRSERRPNRIMGEQGRTVFEEALNNVRSGHVFVLSSVPALGPRLSWLAVMMALPHAHKYEDDLRDQWQSRAHRSEWRKFLKRLLQVHERISNRVSVISGEIHLATHATMRSEQGPLQQFVASGIAHTPPPKAYALFLSMLARLGEAPLPEHPVRLHPLPGQRMVYTAERNYLLLDRQVINGPHDGSLNMAARRSRYIFSVGSPLN